MAVLCAAFAVSCSAPADIKLTATTQAQALRGGVPVQAVLGDAAAAIATIVDDADAVVCTATFIAPHHVVTAGHCFSPALSALEQALVLQRLWLNTSSGAHLALVSVAHAPDRDAAIVAVAGSSEVVLPALDGVSASSLDSVIVAGAGRGVDATDRRAATFLVQDAPPLWRLTPTTDEDGLCPGDSGGPLLVSHGEAWAVVGVHKSGAFSCRGDGHATPLLGLGSWANDVVAEPVQALDACEADTTRCVGDVLERCAFGVWRGADCGLAQFQCTATTAAAACTPTPCGDVTPAGECDGNLALSCRFGSLWRAPCLASEVCALDEGEGRMDCVPCERVCDGVCVSLDDDNHCGDCTTSCSSAERCLTGACVPLPEIGEGEGHGEGEGEGEGDDEQQTSHGCTAGAAPSLLPLLLITRRRRSNRLRFVEKADHTQRVAAGTRAVARVERLQEGFCWVGERHSTCMDIELAVAPPDRAGFTTSVTHSVADRWMPRVQPGQWLDVVIDEDDPALVLIDDAAFERPPPPPVAL